VAERTPSSRGVHRYLAPGEHIAYVCRRHPVVLAKPLALWLLTILGLGAISFIVTQGDPVPVIDTVALWAGVAVTLYLGVKYLQWWKDRYVMTDQRVLSIEGIFAIKVSAVSLSRVTETSFARNVWGRMLGYGDLKLDSAGEQLGLATLRYLPKPDALYRLVTSLLIRSREDQTRHSADPSEENTGPLPPVVL
jgi:uncharacterized membrane protein YdbT with pleckstrin-like domain